jgi:hypothetical protein
MNYATACPRVYSVILQNITCQEHNTGFENADFMKWMRKWQLPEKNKFNSEFMGRPNIRPGLQA